MIRLVVHGSNSVIMAGIISLLDCQSHIQVVGSFVERVSLPSLEDLNPDLLLLEQTSDQDLWWLEKWISTTDLDLPGILLTDAIAMEEISEYLDLGFKAFLPHLTNIEEIIAAINAVKAGLIVFHPELLSFKETHPAITPLLTPGVELTTREAEVLQLLGGGLDNKAIASTLQISKHTVKFHISSILSKLNVSSRTEAVSLGLRQGLIRL